MCVSPPPFLTLKPKYCQAFRNHAISKFRQDAYIAGLRQAILEQQDINDISKDTITRVLRGQRGRYRNVVAICQFFEKNWQEACLETTLSPINNVDTLIETIRSRVTFGFEGSNHHNGGRHQQSQWIQKNYIELDLVEVEFLPSEYPVSDPNTLLADQSSKEDDFDRMGIRLLRGTKKTSIQVLEDHPNIFVYGEPGSGKTSYLQWIALKCREGVFLRQYVPIFVEVRQFATIDRPGTLLTYFETMFDRWEFGPSELRQILESGAAVFIFDGIDETPTDGRDRIETLIEGLLRDYDQCRFIFSSRLALNFPYFGGFQKVIIAPLHSRKHIPPFINRWFNQAGKRPELAQQMIDKLKSRKYKEIRELARRPVLLKLLCIVFEFEGDFPSRRVDVFSSGISQMTRPKYDLETYIPNLPKLQEHDIHNILCRVASYFFIDLKVQILFGVRDVERIIQKFFEEIHNINRDKIPGNKILKGIEQSNGLLVRWAQNYCAFSHLTYQEFFTADHLVSTGRYPEVYQHLADPRWHFVIGLVAELIPKEKSWDFFHGFKTTIDEMINNDEKLNDFLETLNRTANYSNYARRSRQPHTETYIRAWYFAYSLQDNGKITNVGHLPKHFDLPDLEFATSMITGHLLEGHELLYKVHHDLKDENSSANLYSFVQQLKEFLRSNPQQIEILEGWLKLLAEEKIKFKTTEDWWANKRGSWAKRIARLMHTLGLPSTLGLTREQIKKLRTYYDVTRLLSTCMNRSQLESQQRQYLADSMLLLTTLPTDTFMGDDEY